MTENEDEYTSRLVKLVLIGDGTSGKTSLAYRYVNDTFSKPYSQTLGIDCLLKRTILSSNVHVTAQIWHIGGQSIGGGMLDKYLYNADGVILVYDVTNLESFENLMDWKEQVLQLIRLRSDAKFPHFVLVGNKIDLEHLRVVRGQRQEAFAKKQGMSSYFVSAKTGEGVTMCFKKVIADILGIKLTVKDHDYQYTIVKAEIVKEKKKCTENSTVQSVARPKSPEKSSFCVVQ
ncbi:DgyrCDS11241 [Dimorphilus gyrociliatus]|uniref:DgyrCDS11241 n=1 Tax=Dimorphilus gyrociliatus TaxID=2664684 RepID=A0A7I8W3R4_9ANNE|nr:DgyrCDS11241 [Dimorphilus gyrociliatus]